jgi:tripartite-type tricarboxylate transporter receptor subunit TctC
VKELIALAKAKPGAINYASAGIGGGAHLAAELFKDMTGVNIVHIPYKGSGAASIGLIGGQVQLMFANPPVVTPHIKSGKLRALAVTSAQPSALFPGLPTVAASGLPGYEVMVATALFAPAKTPDAILRRLNHEAVLILHRPDVKERFFKIGAEAMGGSSAQLADWIKADLAKWSRVIKVAGIHVD